MKLHEYQAKQRFATVGIPVPRGLTATTQAQAAEACQTLQQDCAGPPPFACNVKAQIHAGGRGKAGGILVARSPEDAAAQAASLLGRRLVTHQTGPEGLPVSAVLIEERVQVAKELYLAMTLDRFAARLMALASRQGGVDIEEVAATQPQAILREPVDAEDGPGQAAVDGLAAALELGGTFSPSVGQLLRAMWKLYVSCDAALVEINPLVVTDDRRLLALDAKVTLDDNALFRHSDLAALRDESQEHPLELSAGRHGLSYVGLGGTIGCLVNGAGLAMATNDIITLSGGSPANFLDVGGGANVEQVTKAFSIILSDARVKVIFVNIFGGIMRCDWIAQGLLNATRQLEVRLPIVVRLQGTNVEEGRRLLNEARRLNLISVDEFAAAARKAVELAATR